MVYAKIIDPKDDPHQGRLLPQVDEYCKRTKHLHQFRLTRELIQGISRRDAFDLMYDLDSMKMLHLPYPALWLTYRPDDFLQSKNWYAKSDEVIRKPVEMTVTFCAYDDFTIWQENRTNPDKTVPHFRTGMGEQFFIRYDDGVVAIVNGIERSVLNPQNGRTLRARNDDEVNKFIMSLGTTNTYASACLAGAMAIKNTVKQTSHNTRVGNKHMKTKFEGPAGVTYISVTTLAPPPRSAMQNDPDHPAREGRSPRPHPRRGHMSHYWVGVAHAKYDHSKPAEKGKQRVPRWIEPMWVNADPDFVQQHQYVVK